MSGSRQIDTKNVLTLEKFVVRQKISFLDFVYGGCEIGLAVAIDLTASNGDPKDPNSLHYVGNFEKNEYC